MISDYELGWFVGLLEGECSFGYYGHTQRVALEMSDEDTIVKAALIMSKICETIIPVREFDRAHRVNRENSSTMFRVQVTGTKARKIMKFIVPHMGKRRRGRIWQCLNGYTEKKYTFAELGVNIIDLVKKGAA